MAAVGMLVGILLEMMCSLVACRLVLERAMLYVLGLAP